MSGERVAGRRPSKRGWALDLQQLQAMMWKQYHQKRRGVLQTVLEVLSPVLVMCALVWAFHLTKISIYTRHIYAGDLRILANTTTDVMVNSLESSGAVPCLAPALLALSGKLPPLQLTPAVQAERDLYIAAVQRARQEALIRQGYPGPPLPGVFGGGDVPVPPALHEAVRQAAHAFVDALVDVSGTVNSTQLAACLAPAGTRLSGSLMQVYMEFINNKGPQPVFTLDEYLLLSRTLKAAIDANPAVGDALYAVKRDFGWNWLGNLVGTGKLAFTPDTPEVRALVSYLNATHVFFDDAFLGILPRDDIETMAAEGYNFWAVVDFASGPVPGGNASYTIRMSFLETPETYITIDKHAHFTSRRYKMYFTSGYFSIESAINSYMLGWNETLEGTLLAPQSAVWNVTHPVPPTLSADVQQQPYAVWTSAFPRLQFKYNPFYEAVGPMLGLLMSLSLLFPLAMLIRGMVEEKETRLREVLCIMGLKPYILQASWLLTYALLFTVVALLVTLVAGTTFLSLTSKSLLLSYLLMFTASELAFGVLVSTLFSRAKVSAVVGPIVQFVAVMPRYAFYTSAANQMIGGKLAASLLAPSAFTFGMDLIAAYEGAGQGMQWKNIWDDPLPLGAIMGMLVLDTSLYFALAAYCDKVVSSGYGTTLPPHFLCMPRYWRRWAADVRRTWAWLRGETEAEYSRLIDEGAPDAGSPTVDLRSLHMRYPNGVYAVQGLSVQMHQGQITALLGQNGAGKSTTVAMMTGLIVPSSGEVIIAGRSMRDDTAAARQSLGLCPQHEVFAPRLTVMEHLVMVALVKGVQGVARAYEEAHAMRETVGLAPADEQAMAATLSGGMKRKLQMGMALIGGSQVVVADEPTSGMDPNARRSLWALLRAVKKDRTILLTTHYMDEADLLADNIIILAGGRLRAQGSSLALKDAHGSSYTLSITLQARGSEAEAGEATAAPGGQAAALQRLMARVCVAVESVLPTVQLVRHAGTELALRLPSTASNLFPRLLELLESRRDELWLSHYSISMPTLEEVFLSVTSHSGPTPAPRGPPANGNSSNHWPGRPGEPQRNRNANGAAAAMAVSSAAVEMMAVPGAMAVVVDNGHADAAHGEANGQITIQHATNGHATNGHAANGHAAREGTKDKDGVNSKSSAPARGEDKWHALLTEKDGKDGEEDGGSEGDEGKQVVQPVSDHHTALVVSNGSSSSTGNWSTPSTVAHAWRCLRMMLSKRAVIAGRDWKGLLYLFLLPVAAVAMALTVLILNLDPTGPRLVLSLNSLEQFTPVPMVHNPAPGVLAGCMGPQHPVPNPDAKLAKTLFEGWVPKYAYDGQITCPNGLALQDVDQTDSYTLSEWLLKQQEAGAPPSYGAIVWADPNVLTGFAEFALASGAAYRRIQGMVKDVGSETQVLLDYVDLLLDVPSSLRDAAMYAFFEKLDPNTLRDVIIPWLRSAMDGLRKRNSTASGGGPPGGTSGGAPPGGGGRRRRLHQAPGFGPGPVTDPGAEPEPGPGPAPGGKAQREAALAGVLMASGMDPGDAAYLAYLLTNSDDPETREELIQIAAGADALLASQLRDELQGGLPTEQNEWLRLIGLLLQGPLGQPVADAVSGPVAGAPGDDDGLIDDFLGDGTGGFSADPAAVTVVLAGLLHRALGLESDVQGEQLVNMLLPLLVGAAKEGGGPGGNGTQPDLDLTELLALAKQLGGIQKVVGGFLGRLNFPPVTLLFNASSYHSAMGLYTDVQQALANVDQTAALARAAEVAAAGPERVFSWTGEAVSANISTADRTLRVTNHPLPLTQKETLAIDTFLSILAAIFCMIPFCYLAGAYSVNPVAEGACGARALQVSSGCPRFIYWAGSMAWDVAMHLLVTAVALSTFAAFGDASTTGSLSQAAATALLILGYGVGAVPLAYCLSAGFTSPSSGQVSVSALFFLLGFMFVTASETMKGIPECVAFQKVAVHFCRLLPPFNLGEGLISMSTYRLYKMLAADLTPQDDGSRGNLDSIVPDDAIPQRNVPNTPFDWDIVGRNLAALWGSAALYFALAVGVDAVRNDPHVKAALRSAVGAVSDRATALAARAWAAAFPRAGGIGQYVRVAAVELRGRISRSASGEASSLLSPRQLASDVDPSPSAAAARKSDDGRAAEEAGAAAAVEEAREDPDAASERQRVSAGTAQPGRDPDALVVEGLTQVYPTRPPKVAVKDLSFGVAPGERFGLLGANGAGKSSTLRVLSGQALPAGGDAHVAGESVLSSEGGAAAHQRLVGYCPQVDPLLDLLSAWEQVQLYARLKAVPEPLVRDHTRDLLTRVGLPPSMWRRAAGTLSGGNKRKASLAIALVGQPAVVLLDEPSSGMDPGARRLMWDAILRATEVPLRAGGQPAALVLTTHYLEEAEALCDRVSIMAAGQIKALGSPAHLKARFGAAYAIELRTTMPEGGGSAGQLTPAARQEVLIAELSAQLPGFAALELGWGRVRATLPMGPACPAMAHIFQVLEGVKANPALGLLSYAVSQPSLESVFLNVCGHQLDDQGEQLA